MRSTLCLDPDVWLQQGGSVDVKTQTVKLRFAVGCIPVHWVLWHRRNGRGILLLITHHVQLLQVLCSKMRRTHLEVLPKAGLCDDDSKIPHRVSYATYVPATYVLCMYVASLDWPQIWYT